MKSALDRQDASISVPSRRRGESFPLAEAGRRLLARWMTHPAEALVTILLVSFVVLSLVVFHWGRPFGAESLRYSSLYAAVWIFWMICAVHLLPPRWHWAQTLRGVGPWVAVMLSYNLVRFLIPAVHPAQLDALLRRIESDAGMGSVRWTHALNGHPHWTDFFATVYLSLFVWMVSYVALHVFLKKGRRERFISGFVLIYAGGFLGYMICPATGPRYAYSGEWTWLVGGYGFALCNRVIANMGAKLDVFPSLHAALSVYLLSWQIRHHPRNLIWGLPLTTAIWLSTIFLGFHYAPDLAAGGILGVGSFLLAPRLVKACGALRERLLPVPERSQPGVSARRIGRSQA